MTLEWFVLAVCLLNLALLVAVLRKVTGQADGLGQPVRDELRQSREESSRTQRELRGEITQTMKGLTDTLVKSVTTISETNSAALERVDRQLTALTDTMQQRLESFRGSSEQRFDAMRAMVDDKLQSFSNTLQARLEGLTGTVERQLKELQDGNTRSLDNIRKTVDEQLQTALERRLTESFKVVSDNLASVQKGLGEMQSLANGVGDLKRVLTNVKTRGTWAEYQLGAILDEILTADQYAKNVQVRPDSGERVEFAVKLPGRLQSGESSLWLPIDSKFPQEAYQRLLSAVDGGDAGGVADASAELSRAIEICAREICEKYIHPPHTTDFAILFVPTEGLFAEVLRVPGLSGMLQSKFRVMVAGPTTLAALLTSLRVGFQTLAIERRASEVWTLLRAIKTEFNNFDHLLVKLKGQLDRAAKTIDATDTRTRAMKRKLHDVEMLPIAEASEALSLAALDPSDSIDESD